MTLEVIGGWPLEHTPESERYTDISGEVGGTVRPMRRVRHVPTFETMILIERLWADDWFTPDDEGIEWQWDTQTLMRMSRRPIMRVEPLTAGGPPDAARAIVSPETGTAAPGARTPRRVSAQRVPDAAGGGYWTWSVYRFTFGPDVAYWGWMPRSAEEMNR